MQKNEAVFEVNKLEKFFNGSSVEAEIEVIVEGRYFKPWKSTVEIEAPISIKVNESVSSKPAISEPKVTVRESKPKIEANKPVKLKIDGKTQEYFVLEVLSPKTLKVLCEDGKTKQISLK